MGNFNTDKDRELKELSQRLSDLEAGIERTEGLIRSRKNLELQLEKQKAEFAEVCKRIRKLAETN
jgi:TolA-binding protein